MDYFANSNHHKQENNIIFLENSRSPKSPKMSPISLNINSINQPPNNSNIQISNNTQFHFDSSRQSDSTNSYNQQENGSPQNLPVHVQNANLLAFQVAAAAAAAVTINAQNQQQNQQMPSPKAICAICGDKASGKHYGVHSCEGCKGFFKRTVRKDLTYTCRDLKECTIDKRQRNRCQYCRYQKCLNSGMKREAVQEERQKNKDKPNQSPPSNNSESKDDLSMKDQQKSSLFEDEETALTKSEQSFLDKLVELENVLYPTIENPTNSECSIELILDSAEKQLKSLPIWAKSITEFTELDLDDQVSLLRNNWREIICFCFTYRSIPYEDALLLANGYLFKIESCQEENLKYLLQRLNQDIVSVIRDLKLDIIELACLKCIMLFDPEANQLKNPTPVLEIRDWICVILSKYCNKRRLNVNEDPTRFAKLLMRLPPLKSWSLKGIESLSFIKAANNFDNILFEAFVIKNESF